MTSHFTDIRHRIFRRSAIDARRSKWLGEIILIRPLSFTVLTLFACAMAVVMVIFLIWGTYTKRSTITGELLPDTGLIKVYVPQPGVVFEKHISEGQHVNKGELLYVLYSDRQSSAMGDTQGSISRHIGERRLSLKNELNKVQLVQREEKTVLLNRIATLRAQVTSIDGLLKDQFSRIELTEDVIKRYQELYTQHDISKDMFQQKQMNILNQRIEQQNLKRDRLTAMNQLTEAQSELRELPLKQQNQLAGLERNMSNLGQELDESEAKRKLMITAPETGIATLVLGNVGEAVDISKPLVSIVPMGAKLHAILYAPSRAIGFIKTGDTVLIRYQAYPYQKFGHYEGTVAEVSKFASPAGEISDLGALAGVGSANEAKPAGLQEPLYLITVNLAQQTVKTYGRLQQLQAGMLLEADVLQETRQLYEWVLEPLFSITGKLQNNK